MPTIRTHGGGCCGIKHIYIDSSPTPDTVPYILETARNGQSRPSQYMSPGAVWGRDAQPGIEMEASGVAKINGRSYVGPTALDRLKLAIAEVQKNVMSNLIEVVTAGGQTDGWRKALLDLGFVETTTFKNSNSGNLVTIWHLAYKNYGKAEAPQRSIW